MATFGVRAPVVGCWLAVETDAWRPQISVRGRVQESQKSGTLMLMTMSEFRTGHAAAVQVETVSEARDELTKTLARFRSDGFLADPVVFGSHRRAEAVTLPYALFELLLPAIEDVYNAEMVRARTQNREAKRYSEEDLFALVGVDAADVDAVVLSEHVDMTRYGTSAEA